MTSGPEVIGASVVWLPVSDIDRSIEFYCQKLGLREERHEAEWAELDANGLRIGLNQREETGSHSGGAVIAFQPDGGLEETVQGLREQGVEFAGEISEHPWGRIAAFEDPDGNSLQLYAPPAD